MQDEPPLGLAADIGGTNARFALVGPGPRPRLIAQRRFACADHATLSDAVEAYLELAAPAQRPRRAVIAIAGPVDGDRFRMTNIAWHFSVSETARKLGFKSLRLVNDFTAIAHALEAFAPDDLRPVPRNADIRIRFDRSLAVLGPGTGLGVGGIIREDSCATALSSEGGHIGFAPQDQSEREIERVLRERYGRVSYERLLSGPGLLALYRALATIEGGAARHRTPAEVAAAAKAGNDGLARASVLRFCAILGSFAGDLALMLGAWGGVFIAGGIVPKFPDILDASDFRTRFEDKGRFQGKLEAVATSVIMHPEPGLFGAARMLLEDIEDRR